MKSYLNNDNIQPYKNESGGTMNHEYLQQLTEERAGIISLRNTLVILKWSLAFMASLSLFFTALHFIQTDLLISTSAGIAILFFSVAALLDISVTRVRIWLIEIEIEISQLKKKQELVD